MRKAAVCPEPGQSERQGVLSTPLPVTPGGNLSRRGHLGQDWALPTKLDPKLKPNPGKQRVDLVGLGSHGFQSLWEMLLLSC